ncbi:NAD(P)H-dependent oxidoreductase [Dysgonomonas sp. ZJ279]|uniref:NAD(P)H-dependent oxidoreductase n=1 Tax=Dysgonomonas sp. ZJ279 TaxID=2709796 RepID=UPI0013ED240F|nr:NAD(P)H-dependent oxidoreductase [Dysgonomonas sp. ZJ279]
MVTIVLAHPWHGSFNKAILDTVTAKFDKENKAYQVIDLHKDNFDPAFTEKELAVFNQGKALDPLVIQYQAVLKNADEIIFIFPIWWGTMPAILKGFFDKVLLVNFAYSYEGGWTPLLKINKGTVITTSQSPTENFRSSIEDNFIPSMLNSIGINNATWLNNEETSSGTDEQRKDFLKKVENQI